MCLNSHDLTWDCDGLMPHSEASAAVQGNLAQVAEGDLGRVDEAGVAPNGMGRWRRVRGRPLQAHHSAPTVQD